MFIAYINLLYVGAFFIIVASIVLRQLFLQEIWYNPFLVYCRELAPGAVSLTGDRAQGDDSKHDSHYNTLI